MQGRAGGSVGWLAPHMLLPHSASTLLPDWRCPPAPVGALYFSSIPASFSLLSEGEPLLISLGPLIYWRKEGAKP